MVTTSPEAVFVSAPTLGLAVVTEQDARVFGPADGAPGDTTLASGWWERGLYLGYSHGLARFDPRQGQFVLLASSHTLDGQGPLDGGEHYAVSDVLADPARGCLWLALIANVSGDRYGIWRYQPAANKFEKVFVPGQTGLLSNLTWNGEGICFCAGSREERVLVAADATRKSYREAIKWFRLDPQTGKVTALPGYHEFERQHEGQILLPLFAFAGEHIIGADGQLYTPDGKVHRQNAFGSGPWRTLEPCEGGFVAVKYWGDGSRLWLVKRRTENDTQTASESARGGQGD
jgi:hypothetical protein